MSSTTSTNSRDSNTSSEYGLISIIQQQGVMSASTPMPPTQQKTVQELPKKPESASIPGLSDDEDLSKDENENGCPCEDDICQDGTAIRGVYY